MARDSIQRTNIDRAHEGVHLCHRIQELTGSDTLQNQVSDIMAQLMHTCRLIKDKDGHQVEFEQALAMARVNFEAECEEDPDE